MVRVADLTMRESRLEGYRFSSCIILGPAVLAIGPGVSLLHCTFEGDLDAIFWVVDPEARPLVFGAVGLVDCLFSSCTFRSIGFAGTTEMRAQLDQSLISP